MDHYIGCSGFYYPQWKNKFYPKGVARKNWLAYYSTIFNTVELNGTFYRQPKVVDLKRYKEVTGDNFTFSVKMSRYISHVQRLKDKDTILRFQDLILQGLDKKLQYFLFQFPATYQYTEENLNTLVENIPNSPHNVVEFRHLSWWNDNVTNALRSADITFCNIDYPKLRSWFVSTSSSFYLRMHGSPELFLSRYAKPKLRKFYAQFPPDVQVRNIYFNNTITEAGYENALELKEIVGSGKTRLK
jgi:uncharacterized protein YecE (DUF72 family)